MPQNNWLGTSIANFKVMSLTPGPNITTLVPPPTIAIGVGNTFLVFQGWNTPAIVAQWQASTSPFIAEIAITAGGVGPTDSLIFTSTVAGQDFEIVCTTPNSTLNTSSTYQKLVFSPTPTSGTFTLTVTGLTTAAITYSSTPATLAANISSAIAALAGFFANDCVVTANIDGSVQLDFSNGRFIGTNVALVTANGASLVGGNASVSIQTLSDGNAGTNQIDSISFPISGTHTENVDSIQTLSSMASNGTFVLTVPSYGSTTPLPYTVGRSVLQSALEDVVGSGNVLVTGGPLLYLADGTRRSLVVEFIGALAGLNIGTMTTTDNAAIATEIQKLTITGNPTAGTFTITFGGQTTAAINWNDSTATVQTKLTALSSIGAGNLACTGGPVTQVTSTGGTNEVQKIRLPAVAIGNTPANIILTFGGQSTASFDPSLPVTSLQSDLEGLSSIGAGNINASTALYSKYVNIPGVSTVYRIGGPPGYVDPGTFTLTIGGQTTAGFTTSVTPSALQALLQGLSSVGSGNVLVTGTVLTAANYTITFAGTLANSPQTITLGRTGSTGALYLTQDVLGYPTTYIYSANDVYLTFINSLGSAPQALFTTTYAGAVIVETTRGVVGTFSYSYPPIIMTFQGTLADINQAQMTNSAFSSGPGVATITTVQDGGGTTYTVVSTQTGGSATVQNISGGTFSLVINGTIVGPLAYNSSAAAVVTAINTVFGSTVVSATGGPAPGTPIVLTFIGALANQPVTVVILTTLTTNLPGSVKKTTLQTGAASASGLNSWDLVISPGEGTLGVLASPVSNFSYVVLSITNTLPSFPSSLIENPIGQVYLPLIGLTATKVESAINEFLAADACRVCKIGHSQEWANVQVPGGVDTYSVVYPSNYASFWYMKDTYRIVFVNSFAAASSLSLTASFPRNGAVVVDPTVFMSNSATILNPTSADTLDLYPEVNRVVAGFVLAASSASPLHLATVARSPATPLSILSWRIKLLSQYSDSLSPSHSGNAEPVLEGKIAFTWNKRVLNDDGTATFTQLVISDTVDWNSPASTIQSVIQRMVVGFFGVGNVAVSGSLANSWKSESTLDAPVSSYSHLIIKLVGLLKGLPLEAEQFDLTCVMISGQFSAPTSLQKNFRIYSSLWTKTLPPYINTRQKVSISSPASVTTLSVGIGSSTVLVAPTATAATIQAALDSFYPAISATYLPEKCRHPITVYGTTFLEGPMEFEFTSFGLQQNPLADFVISTTTTTVVSLVTVTQQGVLLQDEVQLVAITGSPYAGTYTLTWNGHVTSALAYNANLAAVQAAAATATFGTTTITGDAISGFVFDWAAAGGNRPAITATNTFSNAAIATTVTNQGGIGSYLTVQEVVKGRGPNYLDDSLNWSLTRVLNSGDTAVFDDSPTPVYYGIDQTSVIKVVTFGSTLSQFAHTRLRQVFESGQVVTLLGTGTAPAGMSFGTSYIVTAASGQTFSLLSMASANIVVTTVGTGTLTLAVTGLLVTTYSRFGGAQIGLAHLRGGTNLEYLPQYWKAGFASITIGQGAGSGLTLGRFDVSPAAATLHVINTGSSSVDQIPTVLFKANSASTSLLQDNGQVGIAIYSDEVSVIGTVTISQGSLAIANSTVSSLSKGRSATVTLLNTNVVQTVTVN